MGNSCVKKDKNISRNNHTKQKNTSNNKTIANGNDFQQKHSITIIGDKKGSVHKLNYP